MFITTPNYIDPLVGDKVYQLRAIWVAVIPDRLVKAFGVVQSVFGYHAPNFVFERVMQIGHEFKGSEK